MVHGCAELQTIGESGNFGIGSITDLPMVWGAEGARGGPDREGGRTKSRGGEGISGGRRRCEVGFNPHLLTAADVGQRQKIKDKNSDKVKVKNPALTNGRLGWGTRRTTRRSWVQVLASRYGAGVAMHMVRAFSNCSLE
jgi:hypothetical protein